MMFTVLLPLWMSRLRPEDGPDLVDSPTRCRARFRARWIQSGATPSASAGRSSGPSPSKRATTGRQTSSSDCKKNNPATRTEDAPFGSWGLGTDREFSLRPCNLYWLYTCGVSLSQESVMPHLANQGASASYYHVIRYGWFTSGGVSSMNQSTLAM